MSDNVEKGVPTPTSIMGHANGPDCARCGRKITQGQRVRVRLGGGKVHAYTADCGRVATPEVGHDA